MYEALKSVIESGEFELAKMIRKIETAWSLDKIDDMQREELERLARAKYDASRGYASAEIRMQEAFDRIEALENRVKALEGGDTGEDEGTEEAYPAWKQPTGAHDAYYTGSKMTYTDGKRYECIAPEGYAVTYGPDMLPGMWMEVTA